MPAYRPLAVAARRALPWQVYVPAVLILAIGFGFLVLRDTSSQSRSDRVGTPDDQTSTAGAKPTPGPTAEAKAQLVLFTQVTPVVPPPAAGLDMYFGPREQDASAKFAKLLGDAGVNPPGLGVGVYLVLGTDQRRMLVISVPETAQTTSALPDDALPRAVTAIAAAPEVKTLNITRLTLNMHGRDAQGHYVLTTSVPIAALTQAGSSANLMQVAKFELTREGQ
jgi:hypothetical protein